MLDPDFVRECLQDNEMYNILLDNKEQFNDDIIEKFITISKQQACVIAPSLLHYVDKIPDVIILHGVVANLMKSETFKELRNQLQYNDGNLSSVSVYHKYSDYANLADNLKNEFKEMLNTFSATLFIQNCWGSSSSNSEDYGSLWAFSGNNYFGML